MNEYFSVLKGEIPIVNPSKIVENLKNVCILDNDEIKRILGFKFIQFKQCIDDTVEQVLKHECRL